MCWKFTRNFMKPFRSLSIFGGNQHQFLCWCNQLTKSGNHHKDDQRITTIINLFGLVDRAPKIRRKTICIEGKYINAHPLEFTVIGIWKMNVFQNSEDYKDLSLFQGNGFSARRKHLIYLEYYSVKHKQGALQEPECIQSNIQVFV